MRDHGHTISNSSIEFNIDDDEYCTQIDEDSFGAPGGALDKSVQYWDHYFNDATNRFEVPYMFDGSHTAYQKDKIRRKLMEYKQKTCVDLIEIPWEASTMGPFGEKYDNVFEVS